MKVNVLSAISVALNWLGGSRLDGEVTGDVFIEKVIDPVDSMGEGGHSKWPVVIWHGLGDNYNSSGMVHMEEIISQMHPDVTVYRVRLSDDMRKDTDMSFVGDMNKYVAQVCEQIGNVSALDKGFDGIGNSQGGLFLRALQETCSSVKIHNLITFGSPHMGVMDVGGCASRDWACRRRNELLKRQVWFPSIQKSVVPAQYFRNPYEYENYVKYSRFLALINNESVDGVNKEYKDKLQMVSKFVMVSFASDTTVIPKTSASFADVDILTGDVIPIRDTDIYKRDLIGLKGLDSNGRLVFHELEGDHMQIPETFFVDITNDYLGERIN